MAWAIATLVTVLSLVVAGRVIRRLRRPDFLAMDGREFEDWVMVRLGRRGWRLTRRSFGPDGGVDLEGIDHLGRSVVVQCKNTRLPVAVAVVREVTGTWVHSDATMCAVVSAAGFSDASRRFAQEMSVVLMDAREL